MLNQIEKLYEVQEELAAHYSAKYNTLITRADVFNALFLLLSDSEELEWGGDLWDVNLEYGDGLDLLGDFEFDTLSHSVNSPEDLFPQELLLKYKARIKSKGQIWIIHKYDADPFPSNPHAHDIDNNIKLDLSNGCCYRTRKLVYTLKEKDLLEIRKKAKKVFKGELPALKTF